MRSNASNESPFSLARKIVQVGVPAAIVACAAALALAVPNTFKAGDTLHADDLNKNFKALEDSIAELKQREPFADTYPGVLGLGSRGLSDNYNGAVFCGTAPAELNVKTAIDGAPPTNFSHAFGRVLFSDGGAVSVGLGQPYGADCPDTNLCGAPLTFFLSSAQAQTITLHAWVDDSGAVYLDGKQIAKPMGQNVAVMVPVPQGKFALSFLSCSINGPSLALVVYDHFIANTPGLSVDYDRVFHRHGN